MCFGSLGMVMMRSKTALNKLSRLCFTGMKRNGFIILLVMIWPTFWIQAILMYAPKACPMG